MSDFNLSANMMLPIPVVGVDPGPDYALNIDGCLTLLDSHDHTIGKGVQITPAALNLNTDVSFLGNNAINLRSSRYSAQLSPLSLAADVGCVYVSGLDLYFNDISGNQIRITQGGSVNGSTGTITGLPSGTASAAYNSGTFIFQRATNTAANIDGASYVLRNNLVSSKGLTLSPPNAMAADYGIILPLLPAIKGIVTLNSSGNMNVEPSPPAAATSFVTVDTSGNLSVQVLRYQIIVGVGGTHGTITAGLAAASNDQVIIVLPGTYTENVTVSKRVVLQGQGYGTIISGNLQFSTGCDDGLFDKFQITGTVTVDAAVNEIGITNIWVADATNIIINSDSTGVALEGWEL